MVENGNGTAPHLAYFSPDLTTGESTKHQSVPTLPFDLAEGDHNYTVLWKKELLSIAIDDIEVLKATNDIPTIPGFIKFILRPGDRPADHKFLKPAEMAVHWLSFEPT